MLTVQLTPSDLMAAQLVHSRDSRWMPVFGLALGIYGALVLLFGDAATQAWGIAGLVLSALAFAFRFVVLPRKMKRLYSQRKSFQRPQEISWSAQTLTMSSSSGTIATPWSDFLKWREGPSVFLIYMSDIQFHIIPKRAFSGDGQEEFRTVLMAAIGRVDRPGFLPARRTLIFIIGALAAVLLYGFLRGFIYGVP